MNLRPLGPEPSALTKLRYAPKNTIELYHNQLVEATYFFINSYCILRKYRKRKVLNIFLSNYHTKVYTNFSFCFYWYSYFNSIVGFNLLAMKEAAIIFKISPGKKGSIPTAIAFFIPIPVTKDN